MKRFLYWLPPMYKFKVGHRIIIYNDDSNNDNVDNVRYHFDKRLFMILRDRDKFKLKPIYGFKITKLK